MKILYSCAARAAFLAIVFTLSSLKAETRIGRVLVQSSVGDVIATSPNGISQPLNTAAQLDVGTILKTGASATVDLILGYNGTVLRLTPNSVLRIAQLNQEIAGENIVTETKLELKSGALAGTQRRLASPSYLQITTPSATTRIKGTEYYVRADGAVTVVSGEVSINYNKPGAGGSVKVAIPAGYSFDPATGQVVSTTPEYLQNIIADINATKNNAETFKVNGATLVVKPEKDTLSPSKGNNGVGNGVDPQPPGNPPVNDGPGTGPGNPGNKGKH